MSGGPSADLIATLCEAARHVLAADGVRLATWAADAAPAAIPDVALDPRVPLSYYRGRDVCSVAVARGLVAEWRAAHVADERELVTLGGFATVLAVGAGLSPLQLAVEAAEIGTWDWDVRGGRLVWDARCREIFRVPADAPVDFDTLLGAVHPEDRERVMGLVQAIEGAGDVGLEHRTVNGRWVEGRGRAHREDGKVVRVVGTVVNVTERRRAAEALRHSEAQLRTIADALPQLVLATDPSGRADYVNRQWREHTGLGEEASLAEGWRRVVHAEDSDALLSRWRRGLESGEPVEAEARFRGARDGEYRWMLVRALPVRDGEGRIVRWLATGTDIHTQKEAERAMAAAVQVRDDFLSIAGHELKTPLTALHLQLQGVMRLAGEAPSEERRGKIRERLERGVASCERLMSLVDQLLDVSRMNAGRLTLDLCDLDLAESARETMLRFEEPARVAGCELRLLASGPVRGLWDRLRVEQIITNLLANAIKYGAGSPVDVSVARTGDQAVLTVRDRGVGIDVLQQARIFERFARVEQQQRHSGFGLGLWIVHRIVEALGGKISIDSALGAGATFEVRLPRGPVR